MPEKSEKPEKAAKAARPEKPDTKNAKTRKAAKKGGLKIQLVKSVIGTTRHQREVVKGLGLRRLNHTVEREDTPEIRGMIDKVRHIVQILEA
jgi:large subunit ribosomal protein L30